MRTIKVITGILFTALLLISCAPKVIIKHYPEGSPKPRVAVLPFKDANGYPGSGAVATEAFSTNILAVDAYDIIDRGALDKLLQEQQLGLTGVVDHQKAVEIGKILGVDGIITGAVADYKNRNYLMFPPAKVTVTARLINTRTGQVEWSAHEKAGGPKRWFTWIIWPIGVIATATSPSAEDLIISASRDICKTVEKRLKEGKAS